MGGPDAFCRIICFFFVLFVSFFGVKFDIDCGFGRVFGCEVTRVFVWFRWILSRFCVALGVEGVSGRLFLILFVWVRMIFFLLPRCK